MRLLQLEEAVSFGHAHVEVMLYYCHGLKEPQLIASVKPFAGALKRDTPYQFWAQKGVYGRPCWSLTTRVATCPVVAVVIRVSANGAIVAI